MTGWILSSLGLVAGLVLLTKSADWFIEGAVALARRLGLSPLIIGFVIVGFGTSAPEMLVSALAAAQGMPVLSLGNAFGSNITNILLILGVSMLIAPIRIHRVALRRDIPFLLVTIGLTLGAALGGWFSRADGLLMLGCFALFLGWQLFQACRSAQAPEAEGETAAPLSLGRAIALTALGLLLLLGSSQLLVYSAKWIALQAAQMAHLSKEATELIIGLTIVAVGTSLPELMASVVAMRKGQHDIALGNVVGSNCFNICVVAGLALVICPVETAAMPAALRQRDIYVMLATTLLLWLPAMVIWARKRHEPNPVIALARPFGLLYLTLYAAYTVWVIVGSR